MSILVLPGVGIVGVDELNERFISKLNENDFKVHGICGFDPEIVGRIAKKHEISILTNKIEDLMINPEINLIIYIKIRGNFSENICKSLAVAGKHVICIYLLSASQKNSIELFEASLKYPILLSAIVNPFRYAKNFIALKNLIQRKVIGDIKLIDISIDTGINETGLKNRPEFLLGDGIFQNISIYLIDVFMFSLKMKIKTVQTNFESIEYDKDISPVSKRSNIDDFSNFFGKFSNGTIICIKGKALKYLPPDFYCQHVEVIGTQGRIILKNDSIQVICEKAVDKISPILEKCPKEPTILTYPPVSDDYIDDVIFELKGIFSCGKYHAQKNMIFKLISFEEAIFLRSIIDASLESSVSGTTIYLSEKPFPKRSNDFNSNIEYINPTIRSTASVSRMKSDRMSTVNKI